MYKLSIFLYANNEVVSLEQTICEIIEGLHINYELIVYLKNDTCPAYLALRRIIKNHPTWHLKFLFQQEPYIIATLFEVAKASTGTHIVVWSADNEINVETLIRMANVSLSNPQAIVCASKFNQDSVLYGYGHLRKSVRKSINHLVNVLYKRKGDDFYSVNKILPLEYFELMCFSSANNLLYEYTLIALRLGEDYIELPVVFHKRTEGSSEFKFMFNLMLTGKYLYNIIKIRILPKKKLLKNEQSRGLQL